MDERPALTIDLPPSVDEHEQDGLVAELEALDEVDRTIDLGGSRADLQTISMVVELATQLGGLIGPVVGTIVGVIRRRQVKGVVLTLPGGESLKIDEISAADLDRLLTRLGDTPA